MPGNRLDPIDRKILAELQADGRMTNVELAKRVGISAPPCLRRVRTLEEQGFIRGYHAEVDPRELGFEVQAGRLAGVAMIEFDGVGLGVEFLVTRGVSGTICFTCILPRLISEWISIVWMASFFSAPAGDR